MAHCRRGNNRFAAELVLGRSDATARIEQRAPVADTRFIEGDDADLRDPVIAGAESCGLDIDESQPRETHPENG